MPHINSIRLVNVHFNNATQFYEDFRMELGGKNTTYDLENGGGKSLLLLMLLQTVLPKTNLRREKPVSLIFQGGKDRTSHAAVEWLLEEGSDYKYLLTGFSARKRKGAGETTVANKEEEHLQAGDIEHLNWCVFYNNNSITGIKSVPLSFDQSERKVYASFEDIRKYIGQMKQKGLPAEIFDKIEQYQRYISAHGLIAAEWNIIRSINSGENNIESYFRQDATSRKLIENQFVRIIEDMEALNKGDKQGSESSLLADTLIEIRSRLNEYLKLKGHMAEYEKIKEHFSEFGRKNSELLEVFTDYEAYKQEAFAIRKLIADKLKGLEQEQTAVQTKRDYNTKSSNEGKGLKRLLEAGLINYEKTRLDEEHAQLQAGREKVANRQIELKAQLDRLLTLEGYGAFRPDARKVREIATRLEWLKSSADQQMDEYRGAGGRLRFLTDKKLGELDRSHQDLIMAKNKLKGEQEGAGQRKVEAEKQEAVLKNGIASLETQEKTMTQKQQELNEFFLMRGETDALLFIDKSLAETEETLITYSQKTASIVREIKTLAGRLQTLALEDVRVESEITSRLKTRDLQEKWLKSYQTERKRLEGKAAVFGNETLDEYQAGLMRLTEAERLARLEKEIEAGRLRQKKQLSVARGYYVPNEELLALADKLSAKCEFVQAGIDWLARLSHEEKAELLNKLPYLPFAVIVDRLSFEKLKSGRLKTDFASDYPVPIVNIETIRQPQANEQAEEIYYIVSFADLVLESGRYEEYLHSLETAITAADNEALAIGTRIKELAAALSELTTFFAQYPVDKIEAAQKTGEQLNAETAELEKERATISSEKAKCSKRTQLLEAESESLTKLVADVQLKREKLELLMQTVASLTGIRNNLAVKHNEYKTVFSNLTAINTAIAELSQRYTALEREFEAMLPELFELKKAVERLAGFSPVENTLSRSQAEADYNALHQAVSGRAAEENDLRSQQAACINRLDDLRKRIKRDYGGDLDEVAQREENGVQISLPTSAMIETARQDKKDNDVKLTAADKAVHDLELKINSAEVRLDGILKDIPPDTVYELPVYDSQLRYQQEIATMEALIKSYDREVAEACAELEQIKRKIDKLTVQADYYDGFIGREKIEDAGAIAADIKEFRAFEDKFYKLRDTITGQCDRWDNRLKAIGEETANFVIREPLEVLAGISRPLSAKECEARQAAFSEYIASLDQQMQKINHDIIQLENYQQDFIRRCVQRAELVLSHLRKLEALSRIEVYGRRINMIELRLNEFDDKDKFLRMKAHINGIVQEIGEEGAVDRKRISAKLAIKELLAQITDMEKAAVRLYKIESIPENSKFYRWENAIGSDGQNNSLYFIFAACLISFIRMLSIANSSVKSKKVIIADNPFGATSAVYLWNPMFKIMKQNAVQLIAPGHRIPREITSRFGVSYLLNQDILEDGRLRVVVKDVRAEESEEVIRYVEPEQLSMFLT